MNDETNDPLVPDAIERPTRAVRDVAIAVAAVAVAVAAVVAVFVLVEARGAVAEIRGAAAEGHAAAAEQRAFLRKQSETLDGKGAETIAGALATVDELRGIAHDLRAGLLPQVGAALGDFRTAAAAAPGIANSLSETAAGLPQVLAEDNGEVVTILRSVGKSTDNLVVITDPENVAPLKATMFEISEATPSILGNLTETTAHIEVISKNSAEVSTYYKQKILPQPYQPTGNKFVRALKRTGHYSVQLLRATPEIAVVAVQVLK